MKPRKPKQRVYRKLPPSFASDYIKTLRLLGRKHKIDDAEEVKGILRLLKNMSADAFYAGRGEVWIPKPSSRTGYYPMMEKVPYTAVRRAIRKNTSEAVRARSWGVVSSSAEPFVPLFARGPGTLTAAQRRSLLAHIMVSVPVVKGRHPALLGKRVPGELTITDIGTRSIIPIKRMAPEDWEKGFTMQKFSFSEDISKSITRMRERKPRVPNPKLRAPKVDLKAVLKRATDIKVKLEPRRQYDRASRLEEHRKELRKHLPLLERDWTERTLVGKHNITIAEAKKLAAKHAPAGTEVHVKRKLPATYFPAAKTITAPPHASSVAHEAVHARQHEKLGRAYTPIRAIPAGLGAGAAVALGLARGARVGRFRGLPRWVAPAAATVGHAPELAMEGQAAARSWKEKGGKRGAAATLGTYIPAAVLSGLLLGSGSSAAGKLFRRRKVARLRAIRRGVQKKLTLGRYTLPKTAFEKVMTQQMNEMARVYSFTASDRLCYENGFKDWLERAKRKTKRTWKRTVRWVKGEALPAVARDVTLGVASLAHTELGLSPTTIDLVPVQRVGLKRDLQPYPSGQLRGVVEDLQAQLVAEVDPVLRKGMEKAVSDLATELMIRRSLL